MHTLVGKRMTNSGGTATDSSVMNFWQYNYRSNQWEHFAFCESIFKVKAASKILQDHPYYTIVMRTEMPTTAPM